MLHAVPYIYFDDSLKNKIELGICGRIANSSLVCLSKNTTLVVGLVLLVYV